MLLVSYDISNDKLRTRFAKDLSKYGFRLQYSLFEIENSQHIINNIYEIIEGKYAKKFTEADSVLIIRLNPNCEIKRYGYAKNDEQDVFFIG